MMDEKLSDILKFLIQDGKISKKTICIAAKISEEALDSYLAGNAIGLKADDFRYLDELTMLLGCGLSLVDSDERVKSILENLVFDYGFKVEELSKLLNVKTDIIQNVLESKEIDLQDRYSLAVSESYLFYALKRGK